MESEPTGFDWLTLGVSAVGSLATVTALVVAIGLGIHEVRRFRREQAEREVEHLRREDASRRAQAERVAGWLQFMPTSNYAHENRYYVTADVVNASAGPIYEAKVHGHTLSGGQFVALVGMIPPGETGHVHLAPLDERPPGYVGAHIVFRDASERWWERGADGYLIEHDADPWPRPEQAIEQDLRDHEHE